MAVRTCTLVTVIVFGVVVTVLGVTLMLIVEAIIKLVLQQVFNILRYLYIFFSVLIQNNLNLFLYKMNVSLQRSQNSLC